MSGIKRSPGIEYELRARFAAISKADWVELYFDLYRQTAGETVSDEDCMKDAEKRLDILKTYRKETK